MTTHYSLRIVGLHYAANPTYRKEMGTVPEMEQHTVEVLEKLDKKRPLVLLMPNPDNVADLHAVMARAEGKHIGYVEKVDRELFFKLMNKIGMKYLIAHIDSVEVEKRGRLLVTIEAEPGVEKEEKPWKECVWPVWPEDHPLLSPREVWNARYEAERMMDHMAWPPTEPSAVDEMESFLNIWMENSLYDISVETYHTCSRYIDRFAAHTDPRIRAWADLLGKYRAAFYGAKYEASRMEWWESLQESEAMDLLWNKWQYHCTYRLCSGLRELDNYLRQLPDQLYSLIGQPERLFPALFYRSVPRQTLWGIYTALLLRIRTCRKLLIDMSPLSDDSFAYGENPADGSAGEAGSVAELPDVLHTEKAVALHRKLTEAGLLDKQWQPIRLTFTEKGTLIDYMAEKLGIRSKWKFFGALWGIDSETLRTSKLRGLEQDKTWKFREQLEAL